MDINIEKLKEDLKVLLAANKEMAKDPALSNILSHVVLFGVLMQKLEKIEGELAGIKSRASAIGDQND